MVSYISHNAIWLPTDSAALGILPFLRVMYTLFKQIIGIVPKQVIVTVEL